MQKMSIKIGRKTGMGTCIMTGAVDYSFNVVVNGRRLEVTLVQTRSGKFLEPTFWDGKSEIPVRVNKAIATKVKNELIGSRI